MIEDRGTQREVEPCEECGGNIRYRVTLSPWEFEGTCDRCSRGRVTKSWAHSSRAPVFVKDGEPKQGGLFS